MPSYPRYGRTIERDVLRTRPQLLMSWLRSSFDRTQRWGLRELGMASRPRPDVPPERLIEGAKLRESDFLRSETPSNLPLGSDVSV